MTINKKNLKDCPNCIHYKQIKDDLFMCDSWECSFRDIADGTEPIIDTPKEVPETKTRATGKAEGTVMTFTIYGNPVTKKNHGQLIWVGAKGQKKPRFVPSKQYTQYKEKAQWQCPATHINYPVNVEAHYYMQTHRRVDLVNLHEALHDIMVFAQTIEDDNCNIIASTDGSRVHYDKEDPRTEVIITLAHVNE